MQNDPLAAHTVKRDTGRAETTAVEAEEGTAVVATATTAGAVIVTATVAGTGTGTAVVGAGAIGTAATDTAEVEAVADGNSKTTGATRGTTTTAVAVSSAAKTNSGLPVDTGTTDPRAVAVAAAATVAAVEKAGMAWARLSAARRPQMVPSLCRRGNARPQAGTSMRLDMSNTLLCKPSRQVHRDFCLHYELY